MIGIPIIDLSPISGPFDSVKEEDFQKVAAELESAMSGIGFAYLINHGIDKQKIENVYSVSRDFFELPTEVKRKYRRPAPKVCLHGYAGPGDELLNEKHSTELKEFFDIWGPKGRDESAYPLEEVPTFKSTIDDVKADLNDLSLKLLRCYAKFLNLDDEDFFIKRHRNLIDNSIKNNTTTRTKYYYLLKPEEVVPNAIRCGEHSDWGSITLLFQDAVGGLEVKTAAGEWVEAKPLEDAIILNNGQLMEFWCGGKVHAAHHRVRVVMTSLPATTPRQSFIHFVNPDGHEMVSPVVDIAPGNEKFANMPIVNAFNHFLRQMEEAGAY